MIWKGDASGRRLARCLITLYDQVDARWPHRSKAIDGSIGDEKHQVRVSDHNSGADGVVEAIDITHDPAGGFDSYKFAETLRLARDPRVEYVISNGRIFYAGGKQAWQWQRYTGDPHSAHVHVSCQPDPAVYDIASPWVIERAATRPGLYADIVATVFGGPTDGLSGTQTAYGNLVAPRWWERPGVALPARFADRPLPMVRVMHAGKSVICPVIDVGPWNIDDAYWRTGARPQAETGTDKTGRKTNRAGIDLTPAAAAAIGLPGKGFVDWEFIEEKTMSEPIETSPNPPAIPAGTTQLSLDQGKLQDVMQILPIVLLVMQMMRGGQVQLPNGLLPCGHEPAAPATSAPTPKPAPQPAPPAAPAVSSVLTGPGTQLGALLGIATIALQLFGILPPGVGEGATSVGQGISFLAGASPVAGATGLFGSVGQLVGRLFGR